MGDVTVHRRVGSIDERAIIDALPRAIVVTDPDGRIVLWNEQAEQLYGWPEESVLGRSVLDVLAPTDEIATNQERLTALARGETVSADRLVVRRDGQSLRIAVFTRPVIGLHGDVVALVGASEDVTELRRSEQELRDLTEHFRLALEAGGLGTWRWNMLTAATEWDQRLEALFGLSPGQFDGTFDAYVKLLHPDDREEVLRVVRRAIESGSHYRVEHRVVWPDGSTHWIAGAGGVIVDEGGAVAGTVGCAMDITDRVAGQLERERLAASAVEGMHRERLHRERLEFLAAINEALNLAVDVREVMVNVTRSAVPRLGDWCTIHVLTRPDSLIPDVEIAHVDPDMVSYAHQLQERFPYDPGAPTGVPWVIRTGLPLFYPDITDELAVELEATDAEREVLAQLALRSAIAVPLVKRGRVLGAMQFVMSSSSRHYTEDDLALAQTVAGRIASSLENHRLHDQQRVIAQTLQRSLLPATLPSIPGLELAVRYWPSGEGTEVGGDFYDLFSTGRDDCWALVIGDVCGTGPSAAALTGLARHSIRDSAWHGDSPTEVLASLNRAMRRSASETFLTAVYATLDTSGVEPELAIAVGGHPLPILVRDGRARPIGREGRLLGVFDTVSFNLSTEFLHAGDILVLYTDGATDLPAPAGLDQSSFLELVRRATLGLRGAEVIADQIHTELARIKSFDLRTDDLALMVLCVNRPEPRPQLRVDQIEPGHPEASVGSDV